MPATPTSNVRRILHLRFLPSSNPPICIGDQLSSAPGDQLPALIGRQFSAPPCAQPSVVPWTRFPPAVPSTNYRLASAINLSAVPAARLSASVSAAASGSTLRLQPPVCTGCCFLQLAFELTSDLLRRHQLKRTLGPADLCMQVQIFHVLLITHGSRATPALARVSKMKTCINDGAEEKQHAHTIRHQAQRNRPRSHAPVAQRVPAPQRLCTNSAGSPRSTNNSLQRNPVFRGLRFSPCAKLLPMDVPVLGQSDRPAQGCPQRADRWMSWCGRRFKRWGF